MEKTQVKQENKETREIQDKKNNRFTKRYDKDRKPNRHEHGNTQPFHGNHDELKGFVYTYDSYARADQYDRTTEKVADWVKKELLFSMDTWKAITELKEPNTETWKPKPPENINDVFSKTILGEEIKEYMSRKRIYENNRTKVYTVVLGQCSEAMKAKLEGQSDWKDIHSEHNLVKLLKSIKVWMLNQQGSRSPSVITCSALAAVFRIRQNRHEELIEFRKKFVAATQVLEHVGINLGSALDKMTNTLLKEESTDRAAATDIEIKEAEKKALDRVLAIMANIV